MVEDIKDLVRFEPGVSVKRTPTRHCRSLRQSCARGQQRVNVRGLDDNHVPDAHAFGGQSTGRVDYADLWLPKSVEILNGPASALYGSDGLADAISFITIDREDFLGEPWNIAGLDRTTYNSADDQYSESALLAGCTVASSALVSYTRRARRPIRRTQPPLGARIAFLMVLPLAFPNRDCATIA